MRCALPLLGLLAVTAFVAAGSPASADPLGGVSCLVNEASTNAIMVVDSLTFQNLYWPGDFMSHLHNAVFVYGMNLVLDAPGCVSQL